MSNEYAPDAGVSGLEEVMQQSLQVLLVADFGPGNKGSIGVAMSDAERQQLAHETANEKYRKRPTNRWICVDKRLAEPDNAADHAEDEADPQTSGGIVITDTAASFMAAADGPKLSERIAENTRTALRDGLRPVIHGDTHAGKAGCGANKVLRAVLQSNAENIDTVAPLAWTTCRSLGLDAWLRPEDVTQAIVTGRTSADNNELWDATPGQVVDIMIENGAEYEELQGEHDEAVTRADFSDGAFDKEAFAADHTQPDGGSVGAFSASFGALKAENFRRAARRNNLSEYEAALQTVRGVLFNIGVCKELGNEHMFLAAVGEA